MKLSMRKIKKYEDNQKRMQEMVKLLLRQMKGHTISFEEWILDTKTGKFSHKKLSKMIDDMLSIWEENVKDKHRSNWASIISNGKELYRNYLYIVMRSSLCRGIYPYYNEETTFKFLLDVTEEFAQEFCVCEDETGSYNIPYAGFGAYFGCYNYQILKEDILVEKKCPCEIEDEALNGISGEEWDAYIEANVDELTSDFAYTDENGQQWPSFEVYRDSMEMQQEHEEKRKQQNELQQIFTYKEEYFQACETFVEKFYWADVSRFCEEIEEIFDLYLMQMNKSILLDTDSTLEVFGKVYDGYCLTKKYMEEM